ncbi:hypothetical protein [Dysgonomonas sp.]
MKKIILTVFLVISLVKANAQCDLPYKSLSTFGTDTTAFLLYNFVDRVDCYKGKTYQTLVQDLQVPVYKSFLRPILYKKGKTNGLILYMIQDFYDRSINKTDYYIMDVNFDLILDLDDVREKMGIKGIKANSDQLRNYFKDMKVTGIELSISKYNQHYPKYKDKLEPKETKSYDPNKRRGGDW